MAVGNLAGDWSVSPMNEFSDRLRKDRKNAGLTVRQLARQSGISFSYITKIETSRVGNGVSPEIVTALAKALQRDELEYLFLSGVVPAPLNALLADEQSRAFVRKLLSSRPRYAGWDRLENALTDLKKEPLLAGTTSVPKKKPRR
ncbi:helix-turn-helix domain-containing protein [Gimesia maris]|uniref:helix-turn-helix domain-containing protein n=1 Tax=Gimesia maris TaxID=122 RepID=UPI003A8CD993